LGGQPGEAYQPSGWEYWAPIGRHYEAGEYAEAADRGRELLAADPPYSVLYYNVACCESLAGRPQDAIEHLRRAVELSPQSRDYAREDSDFDSLRDEPAFQQLISG
jgi:tetratricopeptide (TPR) repeat protein